MTHVAQKLEQRSLLLIENVRAHPELWKYDEEKFDSTSRTEKFRIWDEIAKRSGFQKTQDAKNKWRTLTFYFRQHMANVAKKIHRRYIPNTDDPNDKYVQPTDWRYYEYMQFVEQYNKQPPTRPKNYFGSEVRQAAKTNTTKTTAAATTTTETKPAAATFLTIPPVALPPAKAQSLQDQDANTASPMQLQIGSVIVEIEPAAPTFAPPFASTNTANSAAAPVPALDNLSESDRNLQAFFDAMLRSTQSLPKFHQERVKRKLINTIRKQIKNI